MATYLLTWNPVKWPWDSLEDDADQVDEGCPLERPWNCGSTKQIRLGDRIFLSRQGVEPLGIIGSGTVIRERFEAPHYDPELAAQGKFLRRVGVRFDTLRDPAFQSPLSRQFLRSSKPFSEVR